VLSLADASVLVAARGRLMQALPEGGAMVAVAAPEIDVLPLLTDGVGIAAVNGPSSVVVSGVEGEVLRIAEHFAEQGVRTSRLKVSHAFHSVLMEPMLEEFRTVLDGLAYGSARIPVVSTVTGEVGKELDAPAYWVRQVRDAVRFADAVTTLTAQGVTTFLEIGPDAVLTPLIDSDHVIPALRRSQDEPTAVVTALARLHASGAAVDWTAYFAGRGAHRVDLPTYAFQRRRYWVNALPVGGGVASAGLEGADHPLLGALVAVPGGAGHEELVLTGLLSTDTCSWLSEYDLLGTPVLPGGALAELALYAARAAGCDVVRELVAEAPLVVPEQDALALRVVVGAPRDGGQRSVAIHTRTADGDREWTRHATATAAPGPVAVPADLAAWPPPGAVPLGVEDAYERLFARGHGYGPVFQRLRAAWQRGEELFAEIDPVDPVDAVGSVGAVDAEDAAGAAATDAVGLVVHPAALEAGVQLSRLVGPEDQEATAPLLPRTWNDLALHEGGEQVSRLRLAPAEGGGSALTLAGETGRPVLSVRAVESAPVDAARFAADRSRTPSLYRLDWIPAAAGTGPAVDGDDWVVLGGDGHEDLAALDVAVASEDVPVPEFVLAEVANAGAANAGVSEPASRDGGAVPGSAVGRVLLDTLALVRSWLASDRLGRAKLVVATRSAVAVRQEEGGAPDHAAVWGLIRSVQAEHPDRFVLVDLDGSTESRRALPAAVATGEAELALREGAVLLPRLSGADGEPEAAAPAAFSSDGTVLVTGGTGPVGALLARHLVAGHGARRLLLTAAAGASDTGGTPGDSDADALVAELTALGADVTVAPCDVADRAALEKVLADVPEAHPLTAVVHAVSATDPGLAGELTDEQFARVLGPVADGARNLHELTVGLPLTAFVLLSSSTGLFHGLGQANLAASGAYLDALARHRRASGMTATSLTYGPWDVAPSDAEPGSAPDDAYRQRLSRLGVGTLSAGEGLAAFDRAIGLGDAHAVPVRLDRRGLAARPDDLPAVLRGLVRLPARPATAQDAGPQLKQRLAGLPEDERERVVLELVRTQVAAVLGHATGADVEPDRAFQELGFDSLAAVDLRKRLSAATGLALPATLVFDHPSARAVAGQLGTLLAPGQEDEIRSALAELDRLEAVLSRLAPADDKHGLVTGRLERLARGWRETPGTGTEAGAGIEEATDDELFQVLDKELGSA
ncbi:KR domain-containing protein, partial [Streptomyces sp. NPDC051921]|uniref:type I polyketide synthase n=1 Tax=Streptomyces sp. NPDC051921 TaxID=3155806 RepID=UPI00342560EC